ncbi:nucleoside diphosphate kinase homolog 7 [Tachypleus tridentatus]|uniref:nucleoside diphosphate kinase homolog 7 n=1 Tax=Tachypleus tridentatus TaxID=6853 RepID=UPI003FD5AFAC
MFSGDEQKYCFLAEWFDPVTSYLKRFRLVVFPKDESVEMYDIEKRRIFLKRTKCSNINPENWCVGSSVNILSRHLKLINYGDSPTRQKFQTTESMLVVIKSAGFSKLGLHIDTFLKNDLQIIKAKMMSVSPEKAAIFCNSHENCTVEDMCNGNVLVIQIRGEGAVNRWQNVIKNYPEELQNACYGSHYSSVELELFFPSTEKAHHCSTATFKDCTCCIIKPHAIQEGKAGHIIQSIIDSGFTISALEMFNLSKKGAQEFYEVYAGVLAEYLDMVSQLISGPCIVMEIISKHGPDTPKLFWELVGPHDPELARLLRPHTLRAKFGTDRVKNALHCTDLPEDGILEVEYFFRVLVDQEKS